jgi:hypothetical protein
MSKNIKLLISEVSRINDLMLFTEKKEVLNESFASVLRGIRTLVKNSADDIAKYGIKQVDDLVKRMVNARTADDFFDLLDEVKIHDEGIAKQLRRDIFDVLPEVTQNRINDIAKNIEMNINKIPENQLDDFLDDIINIQFPNEPDSVKLFMKDTISDNSDTIAKKRGSASVADDIARKLDDLGLGDDVIDEVSDGIDDLLPDTEAAAKLKAEKERYKRVIKQAKKNRSIIKEYTFEEWQKLWEQWKDPTVKLPKQQIDAITKALENKSLRAWYHSLNPPKKLLFWSVFMSVGPTILGLVATALIKRFTSWDDIKLVIEAWDLVFGNVTKLTEENVTDAIIEDFNVDRDTFNDFYNIYISNDKQSARVRGKVENTNNYKVTIVDKEIVTEKQ